MFITKDTIVNYKNERNFNINLAPLSDYWLEKAEEDLKNNIFAQNQSGTDGKIYLDSNLDERIISLTGFFNAKSHDEMAIHLTRTFHPKLKGTLTYKRIGVKTERSIDCRVIELPKTYYSGGLFRFDVNLVCHDPFWKGESTTVIIAMLIKMFKFPIAIPKTGMIFGRRTNTLKTEFENLGDVAGGFTAILRAENGTVTNPIIRNEITGEYIKLNYTMGADDVIEVINFPLIKKIIINGNINGFQYLDEASEFFIMDVGTNVFGYFADENISNLKVVIQYQKRFLKGEFIN